MLVGYARVLTHEQNPALQLDALKRAVCERLFIETASGVRRDRPELKAARRLGISIAALYQHFPGGRGAVIESAGAE